MRLHVGGAMWTHAAWPVAAEPAASRLRAYAGWCDAVEGNTTFYATPSRSTVESWASQTDPDFRFVVKLPKVITHERRLNGIDEDVRAFLHAIEPLGPRAHALWIQLPPAFAPTDVAALAAFLRRLPRTYRYAVEVRHRAFFEDDRSISLLERALETVEAEWIPFDTTVLFASRPTSDAERDAWTKKPRVPRRTRALTAHPIIRYLGRDDRETTIDGWRPWITTVTDWLREGRSPTVFIHTPDNAQALDLARLFHTQVRTTLPTLTPLPDPPPTEPLTLF
ncbi:DUF72 domain-containing protein [Nonomuraea sediminis]|uniref:DUF72 domain-containing protein n=1 Tax=Nonomuraea sediminis TaxID=2835864 RepID=UPI002029BB50|nr:DUF72 domain-containing protein [Nonomuraea sediminis]